MFAELVLVLNSFEIFMIFLLVNKEPPWRFSSALFSVTPSSPSFLPSLSHALICFVSICSLQYCICPCVFPPLPFYWTISHWTELPKAKHSVLSLWHPRGLLQRHAECIPGAQVPCLIGLWIPTGCLALHEADAQGRKKAGLMLLGHLDQAHNYRLRTSTVLPADDPPREFVSPIVDVVLCGESMK